MAIPTVSRFPCSWLRCEVELTAEREHHIAERHPDLLPAHRQRILEVLAAPELVRRSARSPTAHLFSRWYSDVRHGQHVVVVVEGEAGRSARHWIVTAYATRRPGAGDIAWQRS